MTPIIRGLIVLIVIIICSVIFYLQRSKGVDLYQRCYTFLYLQSFFFLTLDMGIHPGNILVTGSGAISIVFFLLNYKIIHCINWKQYRLVPVLLLISFVSALLSHNPIQSFLYLPNYFSGFLVFFVTIIVFSSGYYDEGDAIRLFKYPIIFSIIFGLCQLFISQEFSMYYSTWTSNKRRISSCFVDPQTAGVGMAILLLFTWNRIQIKSSLLKYIILAVLFVLGCSTGSKVFLIGIAIGFVISLIIGEKSPKVIVLVTLLIIAMTITYDYWSQLPVFERLRKIDESYDGRQDIFWVKAIDIFKENWFLGIGPGNFQDYLDLHNIHIGHILDGKFTFASQPESGYLLWLDELGIFSLLWLFLLYKVFRRKGGRIFNISLIVPWVISFVSLYNLFYYQVVYLLFLVSALIYIGDDLILDTTKDIDK